jgi:hypothetical protein
MIESILHYGLMASNVMSLIGNGGSVIPHYRSLRNQRQIRKRIRQNPHLRNKYA